MCKVTEVQLYKQAASGIKANFIPHNRNYYMRNIRETRIFLLRYS